MFCSHCGKPDIAEDAVVCVGCGRSLQQVSPTQKPEQLRGNNGFDFTIRIILAFLIPLYGIIIGIIGHYQGRKGSLAVIGVGFASFVLWYFCVILSSFLSL
jgi:uncharacterized membrane protein YvbJ